MLAGKGNFDASALMAEGEEDDMTEEGRSRSTAQGYKVMVKHLRFSIMSQG